MANKNDIINTFTWRAKCVLGVAIFFGVMVCYKILRFQTKEKEELLSSIQGIQIKEQTIYARRGNIYASDGTSILATSVLQYKMVLDPTIVSDNYFNENIKKLCSGLETFFPQESASQFQERIVRKRKSKDAFMYLSSRSLNLKEKEELSQLPFFNIHRSRGGGYFESDTVRFNPFGNLAKRTVGTMDPKNKQEGATGLEAEFDENLKGVNGSGIYERIPGGKFKPVNLDSDLKSVSGLDLVTTLDVNFQDIAESTLRERVAATQAKYGSVVIMEVETGEIKAMANLSRKVGADGSVFFADDKNYAVAVGTEPGSTFKTASMLAILEKSNLKPTDYGAHCNKEISHYGVPFRCTKAHGDQSVQQVFENSCNIGIYQLMKQAFGFSRSNEYFDYLADFNLYQKTGFQLTGEPAPELKNGQSKNFSSTTVPWMSIGYESKLTPLQMLVFYNAIANNGYWIQPLLVKEIRSGNTVQSVLSANKHNKPIASKKTIDLLKSMMVGVVKRGSARNIDYGQCTVAGKTGTAIKTSGKGYESGKHYASFIGFFPADNPKYSCLVVIDEPVGVSTHGGDAAAPVFKSIADKIYAYDISMHKSHMVKSDGGKNAGALGQGRASDQALIARELGHKNRPQGDGWIRPQTVRADSVVWVQKDIEKDIKNIIGLTLKDALPLLENKDYIVRHTGTGRVAEAVFSGRRVNLVLR